MIDPLCPLCGRAAKPHGFSGYSEPKYPERYDWSMKFGVPIELINLCPLSEAEILRGAYIRARRESSRLEEIGIFVLSVFNMHPDTTRKEMQEDIFRAAYLYFRERDLKRHP